MSDEQLRYEEEKYHYEMDCEEMSNLSPIKPTPTKTRKTKMNTIESHTNAAGATYYSTTDENGQTIYSFTEDFEDIWTQDDQDAIEAGSTPAKI